MAECEYIRQMAHTTKHADLLHAAHCLCRVEYEFYKKARKDSISDPTLVPNTDGSFTVTSNKPGFVPTDFQSRDDHCMSCR